MVNGRIARAMPAAELAADRELQQRLLGVQIGGDDDEAGASRRRPTPAASAGVHGRVHRRGAPTPTTWRRATVRGFNRWNAGGTAAPVADIARDGRPRQRPPQREQPRRAAQVFEFPVAASTGRAAYVAGTFDTKGRELFFLRSCLEKLGLRVVTVDLATSGKPSPARVHPREVARHHPKGERAVFTGDRGTRGDRDGARVRALHRARGATSAASSRPAARAAPRWRRRRCARCRSACRR